MSDVVGTPEHDESVLRLADARMRRIEGRTLLGYATHACSDSVRRGSIGASLKPGLLICTDCGIEVNRNMVTWHGLASAVLALTVYEKDDGNPAEAGRVLYETLLSSLCVEATWESEE